MKTMPNNPTAVPKSGAADKDLALWMLERMRHSENDLAVIRQARSAGGTDILDTPKHIALHSKRLAPLYQGGDEELVEMPEAVVATLERIAAQHVLSCNEELFEKALAAYLAKYPKAGEGVPSDWPTTIDAARAEVEGRTSGAFKPGFTAELATAARTEIARRTGLEKGTTRDRSDDRGS
jgi:hypothetical protein